MKRMTIFSLYLVLFICIGVAQQRVNYSGSLFVEESDILTSVPGWAYNQSMGEWIGYYNVISPDPKYRDDSYANLRGEPMMSTSPQNFLKLQTRSFRFQGKLYYVLIVEKWEARNKMIYGYIFNFQEYQKIYDDQTMSTPYVVSLRSSYERLDERNFLNLLHKALQTPRNHYSPQYSFRVKKTPANNIRFLLPDSGNGARANFDREYFETTTFQYSKIILM